MAEREGMSPGKQAYEERQAKKTGKTLDARLADKVKRQAESTRTAAPPPAARKKPGLISRLLDRAHKPL